MHLDDWIWFGLAHPDCLKDDLGKPGESNRLKDDQIRNTAKVLKTQYLLHNFHNMNDKRNIKHEIEVVLM